MVNAINDKVRDRRIAVGFLHGLFVAALIFASVPVLHAAVTDTASLTVRTHQGLVRGIAADSLCIWRGLRYAKAPVGDLRFRAPQAPDSWTGVRDASAFGPVSPQLMRRAAHSGETEGEDCLSLNVWSPAADAHRRPVMVWIHGGGFLSGSGSSPLYDGAHLALHGDVVVVTINYRLGPLGFLYFGDIPGGRSFDNNIGIRDQIAALQWVHDNIAAFGGDPDMVTVFGESAGAISVLTLLGTPAAHGLFRRAIVESGTPEALWQPQTATAVTLRYLHMLGIPPDSLVLLRSVPTDTLSAAMYRLITALGHEHTTVKVLSPTIDGTLIPGDLMASIRAGRAAGIDLMIGTNKDEATLLAMKKIGVIPRRAKDFDPYLANIEPGARRRLIAAYRRYPHIRGLMSMTTDGIFAMPSVQFSELQAAYAPTYMYRFDWSSGVLKLMGLRACHGLELPFVFGTTESGPGKFFTALSNRKTVRRLSAQMQQAWINFARYGDPNPAGQNTWGRYNAGGRPTMIFDKDCHMASDPRSEQREAWSGLSIFK